MHTSLYIPQSLERGVVTMKEERNMRTNYRTRIVDMNSDGAHELE
jgi:hypothetical protein